MKEAAGIMGDKYAQKIKHLLFFLLAMTPDDNKFVH